jgi:hypothetical protein
MTAPISMFVPNQRGLEQLWRTFDEHRAEWGVDIPDNPIGFVCWLTASDTQVFLLGPADTPDGAFVFGGIVPGDAAFAHTFIWNRDRYKPGEIIAAAKVVAAAVMRAHDLRRLLGLTPVTHVPARVFAERVGFKVQGRLREAVKAFGRTEDAWISDLLRADVEADLTASGHGTLVKGET